jgi:carboxypeptidase C (cathepsin A)
MIVTVLQQAFAVQQADYTQDDYRVVNLPFNPYSDSELSMHSGRLSTTPDGNMDNSLFFFFVEQKVDPTKRKSLSIWLNGGPGCSSFAGMAYENGPFKFNTATSLSKNPYSWHRETAMLYFEQVSFYLELPCHR